MEFSRQEYWNRFPCPPPGESSQSRDQTHISCVSCWQVVSLPLHLLGNSMEPFIKSAVSVVTWKSLLSFLYCIWASQILLSYVIHNFTPWDRANDCWESLSLKGRHETCLFSALTASVQLQKMIAHLKDFFCLSLTHCPTGYELNRGSNFFSLQEMPAWAGDVLFLHLYHTSQMGEGKCHLTDKAIFSLTL